MARHVAFHPAELDTGRGIVFQLAAHLAGVASDAFLSIKYYQPLSHTHSVFSVWCLVFSQLFTAFHAFVNLQPNPLNWADTLSQLEGMIVLIEVPAFPAKGLALAG